MEKDNNDQLSFYFTHLAADPVVDLPKPPEVPDQAAALLTSPLTPLTGRLDLQQYFTVVFNDFFRPMGSLYRSDVLSELVARFLAGIIGIASPEDGFETDILHEARSRALDGIKVVVRTEQSVQPIKLGSVTPRAWEVMTQEENIDKSGRGTILSDALESPHTVETIFVLPRIGVLYWNPSDASTAMRLTSRGVGLMLPFTEIERQLAYLKKQRPNGFLLKMHLVGRVPDQVRDKQLLNAIEAIGRIYPIRSLELPEKA